MSERGSVAIRIEHEADRAAVEALVEDAFGDVSVAELVRLIRASEHFVPALSLVAQRDAQIVGHVLLSTVELVGDGGERDILILSPLAVAPTAQGRGIGRVLVEAALAAADASRFAIVVLEGDPRFYERFGFVPASPLGIERPPDRIPDGAWQAHPLAAYEPTLSGRVVYPVPSGTPAASVRRHRRPLLPAGRPGSIVDLPDIAEKIGFVAPHPGRPWKGACHCGRRSRPTGTRLDQRTGRRPRHALRASYRGSNPLRDTRPDSGYGTFG